MWRIWGPGCANWAGCDGRGGAGQGRWHVEMAQETHFAKEHENAMASEPGDPPPPERLHPAGVTYGKQWHYR